MGAGPLNIVQAFDFYAPIANNTTCHEAGYFLQCLSHAANTPILLQLRDYGISDVYSTADSGRLVH